MNALPNPFEFHSATISREDETSAGNSGVPTTFNSAVEPATVAESAAGPCFTDPTVPAVAFILESAPNADEAVAAVDRPAPAAATVINSVSSVGPLSDESASAAVSSPRSVAADASFPVTQSKVDGNEALPTSLTCPKALAASEPRKAGAAFSFDTQYITKPEYFLDHARRRSMPLISPPLNQEPREYTPDFNALAAAIGIHPRDLDDDSAPLFLSNPSRSFLSHEQSRSLVHALLDLAGLNLGSDRKRDQGNRGGEGDQHQFEHRSHSGSYDRNKLRAG